MWSTCTARDCGYSREVGRMEPRFSGGILPPQLGTTRGLTNARSVADGAGNAGTRRRTWCCNCSARTRQRASRPAMCCSIAGLLFRACSGKSSRNGSCTSPRFPEAARPDRHGHRAVGRKGHPPVWEAMGHDVFFKSAGSLVDGIFEPNSHVVTPKTRHFGLRNSSS